MGLDGWSSLLLEPSQSMASLMELVVGQLVGLQLPLLMVLVRLVAMGLLTPLEEEVVARLEQQPEESEVLH
jgi:hypothetical protein